MKPAPTCIIGAVEITLFADIPRAVESLFVGGQVKRGLLVAINAEKIVLADELPALRRVLDDAEIKYADGISIIHAIRKKYPGTPRVTRIPGCELWEALMERAGQEGTPVFLLGGRADVVEEVESRLRGRFGVPVVGRRDGYFSDGERAVVFEEIRRSGAAIVTVALGSPKQELFMSECRRVYPDALYMGVGGTFDVFTGRARRAPVALRALGLEWLYRLILQPTRLRRHVRLARYLALYLTDRL